MKRIVSVLLTTLGLLVSMIAQPIPSGVYVPQAGGDITNGVDHVTVVWMGTTSITDYASEWMRAEFDVTGEVTSLTFHSGSADKGTAMSSRSFPAKEKSEAFTNLSDWRKFAGIVRGTLAIVDYDIYVEISPFMLVGQSVSLDNSETPPQLQHLIFKREERYLVVPLDRWKGMVPAIGASVRIGQTGRSEYFFPAREVNGKWAMSEEMADQLAEDRRERESAKAEEKKK